MALDSKGKNVAERTEAELMAAAIAGDERAFADLLTPYRKPVLSRVTKILRDPTLAEDVWQDTMFRIFRNLHRLDPARSFRAWVFTIAVNSAKNEIRRGRRHREALVSIEFLEDLNGEGRDLAFEDPAQRPDQLSEDRDLGARIAAAIHDLQPDHRTVFVLREMRGQSYEEIAASIGSNVGTVKSRLHRARSALAAVLG